MWHIKSLHFGHRYECEICDKTFSSSDSLKRHFSVQHRNIRKYMCLFGIWYPCTISKIQIFLVYFDFKKFSQSHQTQVDGGIKHTKNVHEGMKGETPYVPYAIRYSRIKCIWITTSKLFMKAKNQVRWSTYVKYSCLWRWKWRWKWKWK